ncbi:MAG: translocation/assembly module TamB domain-containing protein [Spartobacteria bacterium]
MDEEVHADLHQGGSWRRRAKIAAAAFVALLLVFHRPLLLSLGHGIALHYAAKENLKLDFRLEGSIFTNLTVRNLHAVAVGPSDIESIDVDLARADYGLFALFRHGISAGVSNFEARSARIVLNPDKAPLRARPPNPNKKIDLPQVFPARVHVTDATIIVRNRPHDFVVEHVDLDLDPRNPGELKIDKLQLVGGQMWSKVSAPATYVNRTLVLRDLIVAADERIRELRVDASQIAAGKLAINFDYPVGVGKIIGAIALKETQSTLNTDVHLHAENVRLGVINKYAALPEDFIRGQIDKLDVDLAGLLTAPRSWNGIATAEVRDFQQEATAFDRGVFELSAKDGRAVLKVGDIVQGENQFHLHGSGELPRNLRKFGRSPATIEIAATAPDLQKMTAGMAQKVGGSAEANGKIDIKGGKLTADFALSAASLAMRDGTIEKLSANIKATKMFPPGEEERSWFSQLRSDTTFAVANVKLTEYQADSVQGTVRSVDDQVTFDKLLVSRKQNEFVVRGDYKLPADFHDAALQPAKIDMSLNAVEVGDYFKPDSPNRVTGLLQVSGQVEWKNGIGNGQLSIYGPKLHMRGLEFRQVSTQATIVNSVVYLNDFTVSLNERDFIAANGVVDLRPPYRYSGKVAANIADLAALKPLLRNSGNQNEIAGSLVMNWEGNGEAKTFKNAGKLKLTLEKGRYAAMQSLQANVDASYSPDGLDVPIIFIASDKMDFQAIAQAKGETLEISKIQLDQGKAKYASGYISVPFVWRNIGTNARLSPANGKVAITFQSENLDLRKLFEDVGMKPGVSGSLNVKLDAQGTLGDLNARLDLQMRDLRAVQLPSFEPASFDLTAQTQNNELTFAGKLQQAKIQPIELTANLPFNIPKVIENRGLADDTAVNAKVRLPRSSMNFIRQFVPAIETVDGDLALDVDLKGTIAHPELSGAGDITINVAHFHNGTLPAVTNFAAKMNFAGDVLSFEKFGGELAGGPFNLTGRITFPKLTEPNLDLQLKADSILVARDDTVTARADADIRVAGPLKAASVTGAVALTNSQFFKNLDLIPIGLPGRPAPQPAEDRPTLSFPQPPIRDWKFDIAITTKDPFLIRGNLANGGAIVDLHLGGTGLHPGIEGTIRLKNVEATLPFSRLEIAYGFLYFDPNDSLNPRIDMHGTSVIRDYIVHVYVYGTSIAPEAVFTSEPPLPQEEIISLLATGTTREELTGNNNVLAGRAAMLLVQQLYRKIVKKGEPTKSNSIFDRLELDVGRVDPRTGQQQATARVKINEHFVIVGDVGVGGQFRGMVKYLIRFR